MDIEKQVQKAASLIAQLREVDTELRVFGADGHEYHIGPTLSENELRAFEREHKIDLPPDYRLYLKAVGNGGEFDPEWGDFDNIGTGPDGGLYRLDDTPMGNRTHEPFPYTEKAEVKFTGLPGLLEIGNKGCAYTTHLVVNGPTYGTIWDAWEYHHFSPTGLSFSEWMCDWAERAIPRVLKEKVTNSVKEGMTSRQVIDICGDNGNRPHSMEKWPLWTRFLRFEGLATEFEVDDRDIVVRIINHSV